MLERQIAVLKHNLRDSQVDVSDLYYHVRLLDRRAKHAKFAPNQGHIWKSEGAA